MNPSGAAADALPAHVPLPLERQVARLTVLYDLTRRASRARRPEEVYEAALDALQAALGVDRAAILLSDADGVMRFVAWRGLSDAYRAAVVGHSPWTRHGPEPRPVLVPDARRSEPLAAFAALFARERIGRLAFIPLVESGELLGKFMLYGDAPGEFAAEDIELAETLAGHVAHAIRGKLDADALAEQNARHASLLAAVSDFGDGIVVSDGGRPVWANPAAARILGASQEQLLAPGWSLVASVSAAERERVAARLAAFDEEGRESDHFEASVEGADGVSRRIEVSLATFGGRPRRVSIVRDVTARQRAQAELIAARTELARSEKMSALGSLVSGVAHELRTPLTYLTTNLHLLERRVALALGTLSAEEQARARALVTPHVQATLEAAERIDRLVEDLRRYTRLKAGVVAPGSVAQAVEGAVRLFQATRRPDVVIDARIDATPLVPMDLVQVQQVVLNLLENALDARPRDGRIRVRVFADGSGASVLEVEDSGEGIPAEVQARMWDPFFTTKPHGTGLGLSIVRRIVEEHGASIRCESRAGGGTRFHARFPSSAQLDGPVPAV